MQCTFCGKIGHTKDSCQVCPGGICVVCNQSVDSFSSHKCPLRVIAGLDSAMTSEETRYYPSYSEKIKEGFRLGHSSDED